MHVHDDSQNNESIKLKLLHLAVYGIAPTLSTLGIANQAHGHGVTLQFFYIYYNANSYVLILRFGTGLELIIKYVCSSDISIPHL